MKKVYLQLRKNQIFTFNCLKHKSSENGHLRVCPCRCSLFLRELNAMSPGTIRHNIVSVLLHSKIVEANSLVNDDGGGSLLAERVCNKRRPKNEDFSQNHLK